jgi:protein-disulfide isomerase
VGREWFHRRGADAFQLPVDDVGLFIGNKAAHTRITIVTNPYCKPCSTAHLALEHLLEKNSSISVHVIFSASNRPTDKRQFPAKCFLWIRDHVGGGQSNLQLEEWYKSEVKDYSKLMTEFTIQNIDQYNPEIEVMNQWCEKSQVTQTPTVFINGFRLSSAYSIDDLNYFINHLDNIFSGKELGTSLNPSQFN